MDRPTDCLSANLSCMPSEAAREGGREIVELSERAGQSVGGAPKSICLSSLANSLACSLTELFVPLPKFEKSIDLVQCITLISCKVIHYFHIMCQYLNVSKYNSVQGLCYLISLLSRRWYRTGGGRPSIGECRLCGRPP